MAGASGADPLDEDRTMNIHRTLMLGIAMIAAPLSAARLYRRASPTYRASGRAGQYERRLHDEVQ